MVLDSGALIGIERGAVDVLLLLRAGRSDGQRLVTPAPVLGQVWRGGSGRQARLALWLPGIRVLPADERTCRRAGVLLARTGTSDVVDALVVATALPGDEIVTSDPDDIALLVEADGRRLDLTPI